MILINSDLDFSNPNEILNGTNDNDTIHGLTGDDVINGGGGTHDELFGDDGNDFITAGIGGNHLLDGGSGNDQLFGSDEDDTLNGGTGNDVMQGGSGNDTYIVDSANDSIFELANRGIDTVKLLEDFTLPDGVENLTIISLGVTAGIGNDLSNTIIGGDGDNVLTGGAGSDVINGGDNPFSDIDTLVEHADVDFTLTNSSLKGLGNDTLINIQVADLTGGKNNNVINTSAFNLGHVRLSGEGGDDVLTGGAGADLITGGSGNDTINGGAGTDEIRESFAGKAKLTNTSLTGRGTDQFKGIEEAVLGGSIDDNTLDASAFTVGAVHLFGDRGNDVLIGGSSTDIDLIDGNDGNDKITGGSGDDILLGDSGDPLLGNVGADQFIYSTGSAFKSADIGVDDIEDLFHGTDKIVLSKTTFTTLKSTVGNGFSIANEFAIVTKDSAAATSKAFVVYSSGSGNVFYNQNGSSDGLGTGSKFIHLDNEGVLTASDFRIQA